MTTLLAEAFPLCFSALYCHSFRGFGCSRFVLVVSVPRKKTETTKTKREQPKPRREWQYNAEKHKGKASANRVLNDEITKVRQTLQISQCHSDVICALCCGRSFLSTVSGKPVSHVLFPETRELVSLTAVFWMSRNARPKVLFGESCVTSKKRLRERLCVSVQQRRSLLWCRG